MIGSSQPLSSEILSVHKRFCESLGRSIGRNFSTCFHSLSALIIRIFNYIKKQWNQLFDSQSSHSAKTMHFIPKKAEKDSSLSTVPHPNDALEPVNRKLDFTE